MKGFICFVSIDSKNCGQLQSFMLIEAHNVLEAKLWVFHILHNLAEMEWSENSYGLKRIVNELMCLLLQDEALRLSRYLGA